MVQKSHTTYLFHFLSIKYSFLRGTPSFAFFFSLECGTLEPMTKNSTGSSHRKNTFSPYTLRHLNFASQGTFAHRSVGSKCRRFLAVALSVVVGRDNENNTPNHLCC